MAINSHTRRCVLGAMAIAPVILAVPTMVATGNSSHEDMFASWKADIFRVNHSDLSTDEEAVVWNRIRLADDHIMHSSATGPRIAAMRLWIGLEHVSDTTADSDAICREDVQTLIKNGDGHDWHVRTMVYALHALAG